MGMMGTGNFHRYGISLETGQLLWTSHPSGACGEPSSLNSWVPENFDVDGDAAAPRIIEDGKCLCKDGSIIDPLSGQKIEQMSPEDVGVRASRLRTERNHERSRAFYMSISQMSGRGIQLIPGKWLSGERLPKTDSIQFTLCNAQNVCEWSFDLKKQTGYEQRYPSYYEFRLVDQSIYFVAYEPLKEEPALVPGVWRPPEPRQFHLLTLDLANGEVVQDLSLGNYWLCKLEADQAGVLIRSSNEWPNIAKPWKCSLAYFERQPSGDKPAFG
ncbi:MAG TPA: hypothetical protein VFW23_14445 [Tepidisphaeraceae bacterium]|nr:hypothetical protein [Tepidisphaeraceae bacterium]